MRLVILWAGIAAFVWVGLCPPMTHWSRYGAPGRLLSREAADQLTERRVDTGRLIGRLAAVIALTGGLLYTEPRLTPWLRAHRRIVSRVVLGLPLLCIVTLFGVWGIQATSMGQRQPVLVAEHNENVVHGDSFDQIDPTPKRTYTTAEVEAMGFVREGSASDAERSLATLRQINNFFAPDGMRAYQNLYGKVLDQDGYWDDLTPNQKANRQKVCNHAQQILDGAALSGEQVSAEEALTRAHLEVAARGGK